MPQSTAEPDLDPIEKAVVIVTATGIRPDNTLTSVRGSGFFISKDGYLVTSKHLTEKLGNVDKESITYQIQFIAGGAPVTMAAAYAWSDLHNTLNDVLVLFASVVKYNVPVLGRGTRDGVKPGVTPIYTGGYPEGVLYSVNPGYIKSFGLTVPVPMWTTTISFKEGQSGSPICRGNTRVIAVAKGNDAKDPSTGVVVPVRIIPMEYWDDPGK